MKKLIVGLIALTLAGCANAPSPVSVAAVKPPQVSYQSPQPVVMRPVTWNIYTPKNTDKMQKDLASGGTFIVLTPQAYKNLSANMLELQRYIREQKAVNVYLVKELNQRSDTTSAKALANQ